MNSRDGDGDGVNISVSSINTEHASPIVMVSVMDHGDGIDLSGRNHVHNGLPSPSPTPGDNEPVLQPYNEYHHHLRHDSIPSPKPSPPADNDMTKVQFMALSHHVLYYQEQNMYSIVSQMQQNHPQTGEP